MWRPWCCSLGIAHLKTAIVPVSSDRAFGRADLSVRQKKFWLVTLGDRQSERQMGHQWASQQISSLPAYPVLFASSFVHRFPSFVFSLSVCKCTWMEMVPTCNETVSSKIWWQGEKDARPTMWNECVCRLRWLDTTWNLFHKNWEKLGTFSFCRIFWGATNRWTIFVTNNVSQGSIRHRQYVVWLKNILIRKKKINYG